MFSETWYLLQQEGYLTQSCLCNGLTALRQANINDKKGLYYSAFFEMSIGLERMMKLIIIIDHMSNNNLAPPESAEVEKYKHHLIKLLDTVQKICNVRNLTPLHYLSSDSIQMKLITFLDAFAHPGGRYANINKITEHKLKTCIDPLAAWNQIANQILTEMATEKEHRNAEVAGQVASDGYGDAACNLIRDLDRRAMDVQRLFKRMAGLETVAKYAIYELVVFIAALSDVLSEVSYSAQAINRGMPENIAHIPDMREFFHFALHDKRTVMRKRRWP